METTERIVKTGTDQSRTISHAIIDAGAWLDANRTPPLDFRVESIRIDYNPHDTTPFTDWFVKVTFVRWNWPRLPNLEEDPLSRV